ncbi:yippee family [Trichoderma arundinaceum]|uniref:Yippee family n=1 Tax=Trichoderma arundinaceum TaxID=490622 RepID=A0A395NNA0_TRIAR|nr:yippee family [Trichoderma arundinaceum]
MAVLAIYLHKLADFMAGGIWEAFFFEDDIRAMVRESGISATKPIFPSYLLPSFKFTFPGRRRHSASSTSSTASASSEYSGDRGDAASSSVTTPNGSPPDGDSAIKTLGTKNAARRLSRTAADTLRCLSCATDIAFTSQIISKGFTGRYGRAYLISPPPTGPGPVDPEASPSSLLNVRIGKNENRQLVTGWHVVADICCGICSRKLGWKYVDAKEESQKYKVGKFILETERVVTHRSWEDVPISEGLELMYEMEDEGHAERKDSDGEDHSEIEFDSEDDEECEAVFAGLWDAETAAKRRSRLGARPKPARDSSES